MESIPGISFYLVSNRIFFVYFCKMENAILMIFDLTKNLLRFDTTSKVIRSRVE